MSNELTVVPDAELSKIEAAQAALQKLMESGDIGGFTTKQRAEFLLYTCIVQRLDPSTQPFNLLVLNGKMTLYANRTAADQIRKRDGISTELVYRGPLRKGANDFHSDVWEVEYKLTAHDGRTDYSVGAISVAGLSGEALANAVMKCDTKAKRRGTLSMGGLGIPDESEMDSMPQAASTQGEGGAPRRFYPRPELPAASQPSSVLDAQVVQPSAQPSSFPQAQPLSAAKPPVKV